MEEWRPIKGYEGLYEVSNLGRVKSLERTVIYIDGRKKEIKEKILVGRKKKGYLIVMLCKEGNNKNYAIHRLVAEAFIPNPDNKPQIDHINTIVDDNRVENLRWVTPKENSNNSLTRSHKSKCQLGDKNSMYGKRGSEAPSSRKIVQLTLEGELIKEWNYIKEVTENDNSFNRGRISECCRGKRKTHKGYKWMYYEEYYKIN